MKGEIARLEGHSRSVRGVSFSPKHPSLFCSGGYDALVNTYDAQQAILLSSLQLETRTGTISSVRFFPDGIHIAATSNAKRLFIIDVNTNQVVNQYDHCVYERRDRTALATVGGENNQDGGKLAICTTVDGKGLAFYDIREKKQIKLVAGLHEAPIRDVIPLRSDWVTGSDSSSFSHLQTASEDGKSKILDFDGNTIQVFDFRTPLYTVAHTPENCSETEYPSGIAFGGSQIIISDNVGTEQFVYKPAANLGPVWKLRYTSVGTELFAACDDGKLRRFRRTPWRHEYSDIVISHTKDIEDMDISIYDEYLITASQDSKIGLVRIREPTYGPSDFADFN